MIFFVSAGKVEGKCIICDRDEGENSRKFGVVICEVCCSFVSSASDGPREVFECLDTEGSCQVQGMGSVEKEKEEERCLACWLGRILQTCYMPNLLHDRLRKRLPGALKEKIPTSLARCMSLGTVPTINEKDAELASHAKRLPLDPGGAGGGGGGTGAFGNVIDLPGGWRRTTGPEVTVTSPSGEKFRSMQKLEEFLKNQGICADARVLFGNSSPVVGKASEEKQQSQVPSVKKSKDNRVVCTTLPGGWTRRIKWRSAGDKFDTYVFSPDGRTFRSKRELSAYFQSIGKVDDIHKYFPVVNGNSDSSTRSSSDNVGSSSTEPVSSSEIGSEASSDNRSPEASEVEFETPKSVVRGRKSKLRGSSSRFKAVDKPESHEESRAKVKSPKSQDAKSPIDSSQVAKSPSKPFKVDTPEEKCDRRSSSRLQERTDGSGEAPSDVCCTDSVESKKSERKTQKSQGIANEIFVAELKAEGGQFDRHHGKRVGTQTVLEGGLDRQCTKCRK